MQYYFRVYFNDEQRTGFSDKTLEGKKLPDLDKFSKTDTFQIDLEKACTQAGYRKSDVAKVVVVYKSKNREIEYNILGSNPYFNDVFQYISEKEVWEYGRYQTKREVISTESEDYQEMRDYLLNQLRTNGETFLKEVYRYDDKFKEILAKYVASYSSNEIVEEDYHNAYKLETAIREHLAVYKIYRNIASKRYFYEKTHGGVPLKQEEKLEPARMTPEQIAQHQRVIQAHYDNMDNSAETKTYNYNVEYEEFIEPDEYDQMSGGTGGKVL